MNKAKSTRTPGDQSRRLAVDGDNGKRALLFILLFLSRRGPHGTTAGHSASSRGQKGLVDGAGEATARCKPLIASFPPFAHARSMLEIEAASIE